MIQFITPFPFLIGDWKKDESLLVLEKILALLKGGAVLNVEAWYLC